MPLDIQYDILNDTPATASPVEANFNRIEQYTNQELISRDGSVAMAAQLKLVGDPISALDATPKQYVDQILPVGIIMMYGGAAVPPGGRWALCNGAELETATSPELYAIIGSNFSPAGTPAGRFHLPNLDNRFPMGRGTIAAVGAIGGTADAVVPKHSHTIDHGHPAGTTGNDNAEHTHNGVDHLHPVNIWSGTENAGHYHGGTGGQSNVMMFGVSGSGLAAGGAPFGTGTTHWASNEHTHPINGTTGAADRSLTTSGRSAVHQHAFTPTTMTGRSGDEGVVVTNTNLPPYVGVSYVIRIS